MLDKRQVIEEYFELLTLQKVGDIHGVSRERIRQVMEKEGYSPPAVKKAVLDYIEYHKIDNMYSTCECGEHFIPDKRRRYKKGNNLCSACYLKKRAKLSNYRFQITWYRNHINYAHYLSRKYYKQHKEELSSYYKKYWKLHKRERKEWEKEYHRKNRERLCMRYREYYKKNREHFREVFKQNYIKKRLP